MRLSVHFFNAQSEKLTGKRSKNLLHYSSFKPSYHTFNYIFINRILNFLEHKNRVWTHIKGTMNITIVPQKMKFVLFIISKHRSFYAWWRLGKHKYQKLRHLTASFILSPGRQFLLALSMTINAVSRRKTLCRLMTLSSIPASHFLMAVMKPEAISRLYPPAVHLNSLFGSMSKTARVLPISLSPIFSWQWRSRRPKSWRKGGNTEGSHE